MNSSRSALPLLGALTLALLAAAAASLCLGSVPIPLGRILAVLSGAEGGTAANILYLARIPRTLGCVMAGCSLAVSGAVIQGVLANPLAAPGTLGVNAGAGLMVTVVSALAPTAVAFTPLAAFAGAFCGVLLVLLIAEKAGASRITLVLAGVAISNIFGAGIDALVTLFPDALLGYSDFRIGGMDGLSMPRLLPALWVILPCLAALLALHHELDLLMLGTETAQSLGVRVKPVRLLLLALAAALAGAAVSISGLLGFVGLIVPHALRRFTGSESRVLLPACALGGAVLLTLCDLASRTLFAPFTIPVGIVMSLTGGPFFLWLLLARKGGRSL